MPRCPAGFLPGTNPARLKLFPSCCQTLCTSVGPRDQAFPDVCGSLYMHLTGACLSWPVAKWHVVLTQSSR